MKLVSVSKSYGRGESKVQALNGVSVAFHRGRFTAVMGPSGSGKSTLLQCAAGIDRIDEGVVEISGTSVNDLSESALTKLRRDRVGFIFQAFNLVPSLTARQNVALPLMLAGKRPARRDVDSALDGLGLAERRRHRPNQLSGGQQQRVAIARALVTRPEVLFADEPTGALDSRSSRQVMELLRQLVDGQQQTIIMVTHDPVAASYADEVLFLADGQLAGSLAAPTAESVAARITQLEGAR